MFEPGSKNGWTRVAFGDVVHLSRERSSDPQADGFRRYIGLEHMEPGELKLRRWGDLSAGTTFTNVFRAGQVLFGKRRAYQRKVAVADFDGVCSSDIYALEAKPEHLLPELLPFICQTDGFVEHAVGTSAGSLSPRTKWESLASYEFALPPLDEQRRIVEVLVAAGDLVDAYDRQLSSLRILRHSFETSLLVGGATGNVGAAMSIESVELPPGWNLVSASSVCSAPITSGVTPRNGEEHSDRDCPFIKVRNLSFDGELNFGLDGSRLNPRAFEDTKSLHVVPGDILTNIVGPPLGKVSVVPASIPEALINQAIVRFRPVSPEIGSWLLAYLMSPWAKRWLFVRSKKTSGQRNINATTCSALPVPMPPESQRLALAARIDEARDATEEVRQRARQARGLVAGLLALLSSQ